MPGLCVGADAAEAVEDDALPFDLKMNRIDATLREQPADDAKLDMDIARNLKELDFGK